MSAAPGLPDKADALPELSVVLVVGGQRERAAAALRSLLEQETRHAIEVLLVDLGPRECGPLAQSDDARVHMIRPEGECLLAPARVRAVHAARAPLVAFMEEHCEAQPGWTEAVIAALRDGWAAVSGDFILRNPKSGTTEKAFRMTYGDYLRPRRGRGRTDLIAGQNAAFRRDLLLGFGDQLELMLKSDVVLQAVLRKQGHELFYEPAAKIAHRSENSPHSLCRGAFYWNWCFAHVRAQVFRWSLLRKIIRVALTPLIPWVRLARLVVWIVRRSEGLLPQLVRDTPFVLAVNYASAAGQAAGLLRGIEVAEREFSYFEMNEPRLLQEEWEAVKTGSH
jgi:GT2 family glycosyltransferase